MRIRRFRSKVISLSLIVAITATYSMFALAAEGKIAGEILVTGSEIGGKAPLVLVNGEETKSGRSIFSSSLITTSENAGAIVNLGRLGTLRVSSGTEFSLSFGEDGISSRLLKGELTVISSSKSVDVTMPDGTVTKLTTGKSAATIPQDDDDDDDDGSAWWLWAVIVGGATAAVIFAATSGNNRVDIGGGTSIVSANN